MQRQNKPSIALCASTFVNAVQLGLFCGIRLNGGHRSPVEAAIFMSKQTNVALRHRTAQGFKP